MKNIICLGEMLIDMVDVDHRGLVEAQHYDRQPGGASANVAIAIARLGGKAHFLGTLGKDHFGDFLAETLRVNGVETSMVERVGKTTLAWVGLTPEGERDFLFDRGSDGDYTINLDKLANFSESTVVHFGSATAFLGGPLGQSYQQLLSYAKQRQWSIVFDPNYREALTTDVQAYKRFCEPFIREAALIKMSEGEALLLSNQPTIELALDYFSQQTKAKICVTQGAQGTLVMEAKRRYQVPSMAVKQVDATGAGDAFIGALIYALTYQDGAFSEAVAFANKAGAFAVQSIGAINSLPTLNDIQ